MPEKFPQSGRRSLRDIARERRNRENEQPAAAIYDDAQDVLERLRAIRNRSGSWIDTRDDAVINRIGGMRALDSNYRVISKPVIDIRFGKTGIKAFVRDLSPKRRKLPNAVNSSTQEPYSFG